MKKVLFTYSGVMSQLTPRKRRVCNYAKVDKEGFLTPSQRGVKSKTNKGRKTKSQYSTPNSENANVNCTNLEQVAQKLMNSLHLIDPLRDAGVKGTRSQVLKDKKEKGEVNDINRDTSNLLVSSISDMASNREAEKDEMREKIRQLEEQVRRQEEERKKEQEDEEFRQLKEKMSQLERKLSESQTPSSKRVKTHKQRGNEHEYQSFYDSKIPTVHSITKMLDVTEKRDKARKSRKGRKRKGRRRDSSTDSSEDSTTTEDSSNSNSDESSNEDRNYKRPRHKKGRTLKSGLHAKKSNTRVLSNEMFAHTALDSELD